MQMEDRILRSIEKHKLIKKADTIIVGASGGPDSQFMIYILNSLKSQIDFEIILAHLNHLHRKEARNDENLVRKTAEELNLKFFTRARSMDDYAREHKISSEDAGRRLRYEFFNELAKEYKNSKIAVAHNKDDQAETVLMRIIRGTGLDGLRAMDYKSGNIIRPILDIKKSEILAFLDSKNIAYAIDHTNFENDYTRNKIRLDIIPKLEDINPRVIDQIYNLSELAKDDLEILDEVIDDKFTDLAEIKKDRITFDKAKFDKTDSAILRRIIRKAIETLNGEIKDISKENIDEYLTIRDLDNGKKIIKDRLRLRKSYDSYILEMEKTKGKFNDELYLKDLDLINFDGLYIKTSIINSNKYEKSRNIGYFDYDKLKFPLKVRTRKNGDRFTPLGHKSEKKLKDFFIDQKVDREKRDDIPLIISNDKIIWLIGLRISDNFKVTESTKRILKIEVCDENKKRWDNWKNPNWWRKS